MPSGQICHTGNRGIFAKKKTVVIKTRKKKNSVLPVAFQHVVRQSSLVHCGAPWNSECKTTIEPHWPLFFSGDWPVGQPSFLVSKNNTPYNMVSLSISHSLPGTKNCYEEWTEDVPIKGNTSVSVYTTCTTICNKSIWSLPFIFRTKQLNYLNHSWYLLTR